MGVNVENFNRLITHLKGIGNNEFDMRTPTGPCGCCIAHAARLGALLGSVASWFGLVDGEVTDALFLPADYRDSPRPTDRLAAIAELERFRDGGKPDPLWLRKSR